MILGGDLSDAREIVCSMSVDSRDRHQGAHIFQIQTLSSPLVPVANEDDSLALKVLKRGIFLVEDLSRHAQLMFWYLSIQFSSEGSQYTRASNNLLRRFMLTWDLDMMLDHCLRSSRSLKSRGRSELRTINAPSSDERSTPTTFQYEGGWSDPD